MAVSGDNLWRFNLWATAVFAVAAGISVVFADQLRIPFAVLSCTLFAFGTIAFLWAFAVAVDRSRHEDVSVAMVYGMSAAPKETRRRFHGLTAVQTVIAIVAASIHPFTAHAFGILATMLGIGLAGLWTAKYGTYAERTDGRYAAQRSATARATTEEME